MSVLQHNAKRVSGRVWHDLEHHLFSPTSALCSWAHPKTDDPAWVTRVGVTFGRLNTWQIDFGADKAVDR